MLTGGGKFILTRERNENFVANPADVDNGLSRQSVDEFAVEKGDHGMLQGYNVKSLSRQILSLGFENQRKIDAFALGDVEALG